MKVFIKNSRRTVMIPEVVSHDSFGIGKVTAVKDVNNITNAVSIVIVDFENDICKELPISQLRIIK
jgi:hypothetical protein